MTVKAGQNVMLGVGDSSLFRLLGGSFGEAGDTGGMAGGTGSRYFPSSKAKILKAAYASYYGGGDPSAGIISRDPRDYGGGIEYER